MSQRPVFDSIFRPGLFTDQVVLVTGGGTGIGRCIAHELASLGATVVLAARRAEPLEQTAAEIVDAGGRVDTLDGFNIRDPDVVDAAIGKLLERHGRLDAVVNNAGGQFASPAAAIRPKGWRAVIETNLNGTWFVCQSAFNRWMSRQGGNIVTIVADMWNGFPGMAHTGAARAAVVNLTKTLSLEWASAGVRVNAVAPGFILSSGLTTYPEVVQQMAAQVMPKNPSSRVGTESEVSAAVCFLLSPAAAFVTGETIRVDGGASLQKQPLMPLPEHDKNAPFDAFALAPELPPAFAAARERNDEEGG